uniref:Uncharacterized protein n=1 Tax=Arundo donax TaxID=35708 RepID=A0A0A9GX06_ARUDO
MWDKRKEKTSNRQGERGDLPLSALNFWSLLERFLL